MYIYLPYMHVFSPNEYLKMITYNDYVVQIIVYTMKMQKDATCWAPKCAPWKLGPPSILEFI